MKTTNVQVSQIPHGAYSGCSVVRTGNSRGTEQTFIKTADGQVFSAHGRGLDLGRDFGTNDAVRRVYCKLAGISFTDLKSAMRAERQRRAKHEAKRNLEWVRTQAKRLGLRLTGVKAK